MRNREKLCSRGIKTTRGGVLVLTKQKNTAKHAIECLIQVAKEKKK